MVEDSGDHEPAIVNVLLDTGSVVAPISEELVARLQQTYPGEVLKPFQGTACVRTSFGKVRAVFFELLTPWRKGVVQVNFCGLTGLSDMIILGQITLREALCIDVVADPKRMVTGVQRGDDDGVARTLGGGEQRLGILGGGPQA